MGEGAAAVAVAECPHARYAGAKLVVDLDVAAGILLDPGAVEPEVVRVRSPSGGDQKVGAGDLPFSAVTVERHDDVVALFLDAEALGVPLRGHPRAIEESRHCLGNIFVLTRNEAWPDLHDRHLAAEAAVHLAKLESDVAATQ